MKQIELSAPQEGKKSTNFYDEEEYCKHLIGNGWSIVVVEHIMKGIKEMYPSKDFFRQYKGFNYTFPWPRKFTNLIQLIDHVCIQLTFSL